MLYYIRKIICDETHSHSLQIVFVALTELAGDHGFSFAHIVDWSLNCDDAFEIETIDVVDTTDGDLCIGVLHDSFDCVTALTNNPTDEVIVRENLQRDLTVNNDVINVTIQLTVKQRFGRVIKINNCIKNWIFEIVWPWVLGRTEKYRNRIKHMLFESCEKFWNIFNIY